jgi:hypothetical protein
MYPKSSKKRQRTSLLSRRQANTPSRNQSCQKTSEANQPLTAVYASVVELAAEIAQQTLWKWFKLVKRSFRSLIWQNAFFVINVWILARKKR